MLMSSFVPNSTGAFAFPRYYRTNLRLTDACDAVLYAMSVILVHVILLLEQFADHIQTRLLICGQAHSFYLKESVDIANIAFDVL